MSDYKERTKTEKDAYEFWESFVEEITYRNRFTPQHPLVAFLAGYLPHHTITISQGTILYRARVIDYGNTINNNTGFGKFVNHEECGSFEGYDESNSFVPPAERVTSGRANPERIVYLYAAKEIITAIGETRPRIYDHISVAKIQLQKEVRLANLATADESDIFDLDRAKLDRIERAFSRPCREAIDYVPTQYIAEYIKSLGYDGITFRSSFVPGGTNVTIFNPQVAKAIASAPYKMDSITYRARRIFPLRDIDAFDIIATNRDVEY